MNKREGIIYALGIVKGFLESDKDYKTVKLNELFGSKYDGYELGLSNGDKSVCLYDTRTNNASTRRRVIEIDRHFYLEDLVQLILQALAMELRLQKG